MLVYRLPHPPPQPDLALYHLVQMWKVLQACRVWKSTPSVSFCPPVGLCSVLVLVLRVCVLINLSLGVNTHTHTHTHTHTLSYHQKPNNFAIFFCTFDQKWLLPCFFLCNTECFVMHNFTYFLCHSFFPIWYFLI